MVLLAGHVHTKFGLGHDLDPPHRSAFDVEREILVRRGADLAAALLASAQQAATLLAAGEGEQRFRERVRRTIEVAARPVGAS